MSLPPNLPKAYVPRENDDYVPYAATLDGVTTTAVDLAIIAADSVRPVPSWTAHPGPKTPTTPDTYLVFIRAQGSPKPATCLGWLIVY